MQDEVKHDNASSRVATGKTLVARAKDSVVVRHDPGSRFVALPANSVVDDPRQYLGPHGETGWRTIFTFCATCMALFIVGGALIGLAVAEHDHLPASVGVVAGVTVGVLSGGFVTLILRPPHAVILLIACGFAPLLSAMGAVGLQLVSGQRLDLRLAHDGHNDVDATLQSITSNNNKLLIWCLAFGTIALIVSLACAYGIVREGLRRTGRVPDCSGK